MSKVFKEIAAYITAGIVALSLIGMFILILSVGGDKGDRAVKPVSSKLPYRIICVEGHEYYEASSAYGDIAIKLTDDGKPCKCEDK